MSVRILLLALALAGCAGPSLAQRALDRAEATCVLFEAYQREHDGRVTYRCTPHDGTATVAPASFTIGAR